MMWHKAMKFLQISPSRRNAIRIPGPVTHTEKNRAATPGQSSSMSLPSCVARVEGARVAPVHRDILPSSEKSNATDMGPQFMNRSNMIQHIPPGFRLDGIQH